jgi:flagellar hook protein FlgE
MLRAMYSGVSGLLANEEMLDVIGNNIANVNTVGFKSGSADFASVLSQTVSGAASPQNGDGGTNAAQVGLGVQVAGIGTNFTQGADQQTGVSTDLAVEGSGMLVVSQGGEQLYTRDGTLSFDANGDLVNPEGAIVQGWMAAPGGAINNNGPLTNIVVPTTTLIPPIPTGTVTIGGNLPTNPTVNAAGTATVDSTTNVYDAQGTATPVTFAFTYTAGTGGAAGTWAVQAQDASGTDIGTSQALTFNSSGVLTAPTNYAIALGTGATAQNIAINFAAQGAGLVSYGGTSSVNISQDGQGTGNLQSITIGGDGVLSGIFSNGQTETLGQVAVAGFSNPSGLTNAGGSMYNTSANSGTPQIGAAGTGGRGTISSGVLEGSNVDLSQAFSDLIVAQRGFEANSKVVTTSDQILQDLIAMKQ